MKELSIKEKAKAYDEALQRARDSFNYPDFPGFIRADVVFPELKVSEDEKIRKDLMEWIKEFPDMIWRGHYKKDVLAWLEKQGEKPTTIDIDKMVLEYSQTKNSDFGLPINCMIEAYRKGINDALHSHILDPNKVIEWLCKNTRAACWDNPDEGVSQRIEQFKEDFEI